MLERSAKDACKHVIFATLTHMQGFPPIDTQLAQWEKAIDEIYEAIKNEPDIAALSSAPPPSSAQQQRFERGLLRTLVDAVWNEATESMAVPSTAWADRMIDRVFGSHPPRRQFKRGDVVRKKSGSEWHGTIVGEYSTVLTPEGYAVESAAHAGSVQIYPAKALERLQEGSAA